MSGLHLDFLVYLGDPDEGAESCPSADLLKRDAPIEGVEWPGAYGAVVVDKGEKRLLEPRADPIFKLVSHLVRSIYYLLEGESETVEMSESEHGFLLEPSGDDIRISFFAGSAYDPDEYILEEATMPLLEYGKQVLDMGDRLRDIMKKDNPEIFEDEFAKSLPEFLDMSGKAYKTYKLEKDRGLRGP